MKVEELIIDGFKSYATRTVISGWDSQFNAITGLNGSGKSNILDAICFVLGISSMNTVRASNLQDLIYKRGQAGVTKASVTIVFDNSETAKSPIGFEKCAKISVTRQIILGGTSKYLINGHKTQQQTVLNLFQSIQLNINNPNFLIMQGRITKVLNMKPSEILSLIEEAAGTRTFEERKEKAQKTMAKKEAKLSEIRSLLHEEIEPKLEKLRNEKRTFLEFQQVQTDLEKISRIKAAHDYVNYSRKFDEISALLREKEDGMMESEQQIKKLDLEIKNLARDLEEVKAHKESELSKNGSINELEKSENELNDELTRLNASMEIMTENLRAEEDKSIALQRKISDVEKNIALFDKAFVDSDMQHNSIMESFKALKNEYSKKEELLGSLSTGVSMSGNTEFGYVAQLKEYKELLNQSNMCIQESRLKIQHLKNEIKANEPKVEEARSTYETLLGEIETQNSVIKAKEQELAKSGFEPKRMLELKEQEEIVSLKIELLNKQLSTLRNQIGEIDFTYTKPSPSFNDKKVRGIAARLFHLDEANSDKALALQVCAGSRLYNVIVEDSESGSLLLEKGKLKKRVTIIPLDKIHPRVAKDSSIQAAKRMCPGKADLALNLIDFDNNLLKAMQYIFGNTFICQDPQTAKTITFSNEVRTRSITFEGDTYDPEGNLSGGSRRTSFSVLLLIQKYDKLMKELEENQKKLEEISLSIQKYQIVSNQTSKIQNEINVKLHELSLMNRKLQSNPAALFFQKHENDKREIDNLLQLINGEEAKCQNYEKEIKHIEKEIEEFNTDKGAKLKNLQKEVNLLKSSLQEKESEMAEHIEKHQSKQLDLDGKREELESLKLSFELCSSSRKDLANEVSLSKLKVDETVEKLLEIRSELDDKRSNLLGLNEEFRELSSVLETKTELSNSSKLHVQKLKHDLDKMRSVWSGVKEKLNKVIEQFEWVLDGNVVNGILQKYPNINIDEYVEQVATLEEKFQGMKRKVNTNIMNMIDNVEKKEASLRNMIKTIEKDKSKIENTVAKLNGYKRDTLNNTYKKVSVDFGNIFSDLLPGSFAKLVPIDDNDVTKGLEVKVKLGTVWKESLVELSGGQRSLVALSLIMALLQFKPAPMYILDEVDAALDLSHTQNIGHLIKTRFKGSQFIVVSLKEGMFTNANRVFRTRFQDGTSMVSVM